MSQLLLDLMDAADFDYEISFLPTISGNIDDSTIEIDIKDVNTKKSLLGENYLIMSRDEAKALINYLKATLDL